MADTTTFDPLFREVVAPRVNSLVDESTILLRWLERRKRRFVGNKWQVPLNINHNQGIGARGEFGDLPAAGQEDYKRATFANADNWGQMKFSQRLINQARSEKGALKESIASETDGLVKSISLDLNRQCFGDGTGLLATLGTTGGSTTVVCTDTKRIKVNMRVDILVKSSGAVLAADRKVTKIVKNTSFDIDGAAVTTSNTHGVYRAGNTVGATNYEFPGLAALVKTTGAYGNLNPSTAGLEMWAGNVFTGVTGLTDEKMQKAWDAPHENGIPASNDRLVIGTYGTRREYGRLLQTQRRFNDVKTRPAGNTKLQGGGFDALEYNGTDFVVDRDVDAGVIYYLDSEAIEYLLLERGFKNDDGSVLKDDGGTGYTAPYYVMSTIGTDNRGAHSKQEGVTEA